MTMTAAEHEKFWQDLMPPGVTCSDEGFGNWLEKLQNALDAAPSAYDAVGGTPVSKCCAVIIDSLDTLRAGFELRQINLLREMIVRGGGDVDTVVNMALSIGKSLTPDRVAAFGKVLDAFDQRHNGHGLKMLAEYVMVSCGYTIADNIFFVIHLADKDIAGAGFFRRRLSENGDPPFVLYMLTCGVDPFDSDILRWQRDFTPKDEADKNIFRVWRKRCESHPDWAAAAAQLAALETGKAAWRAEDFLQPVSDNGPRLIDIVALSGKAAALMVSDRWAGRLEDFNRITAALEENLAVLPVDKALVNTQIRVAALQGRKKPTVKFGK